MNISILSVKNRNNIPYKISAKSYYAQFLSIGNQLYLSKKIYLLHKNNQGNMQYLHFKEVVPHRMNAWALTKNINYVRLLNDNTLIGLDYINKIFIEENLDLYTINAGLNHLLHVPNINVFKTRANIGKYMEDDGNIIGYNKKINEFSAEDMRCLDFADENAVYISNKRFRNDNKIPVNQRSMHARAYDRDNEGFQTGDPSLASRTTKIYGYDMNEIYKIVDESLAKTS